MIKNTPTTYGSLSKTLHWLVFLMFMAMFALGFGASFVDDSHTVGQMFFVHKSLGLTLLGIMIFRLIWRLCNVSPGYGPHVKAWERLAAKSLHWAFYCVIFAMLASGWVTTSTGKHGVTFWGWFNASLPLGRDKALHHLTSNWHTILAWTLVGMIALHLIAALKHHFVNHDDVLKRMMPSR